MHALSENVFWYVLTLRIRLNFYPSMLLYFIFLIYYFNSFQRILYPFSYVFLSKNQKWTVETWLFVSLIACFIFFRLLSVSPLVSDGHSSNSSFSRFCFAVSWTHSIFNASSWFSSASSLDVSSLSNSKTLLSLLMHFHLHLFLLSF